MSWLRRVVNTFRRAPLDRDIDREIAFHLHEREDDLRDQGLSDDDARRTSRMRFGSPLAQRDRTRDVDISQAIDAMLRNIRYALRAMRRTPGFTAAVVLTLALGIGANSAVFSAIDAVLLRPLPYPGADRLVELKQVHERSGEARVAPVRLQDWIRLNTTFDGIAGYMVGEIVDPSGELPERIQNVTVTAGFFDVLGVRPAIGRSFAREEHHFGYKGPEPVILSDRRWRSLGSDRQPLGQPLRVGNATIATIGVMPATCRCPANSSWPKWTTTEVMVNRTFAERYFQGRGVVGLHVTGGLDRLVQNRHITGAFASRIVGVVGDAREAGVDREPAPTVYTCFSYPNPAPWHVIRTAGDPAAAVTAIRHRIRELEPARSVHDIAPLEQRMGDAYAQTRLRTWLLSLFAITALALVCAGVYGTLAYAVSLRRREVALRLALGALRTTVVKQLMGTSIRVVAAASVVGLGLALMFTRSLSTMLYGVTPADPATLTGVVAVVVTVASIAAAVPAARAVFMQPMRALREE